MNNFINLYDLYIKYCGDISEKILKLSFKNYKKLLFSLHEVHMIFLFPKSLPASLELSGIYWVVTIKVFPYINGAPTAATKESMCNLEFYFLHTENALKFIEELSMLWKQAIYTTSTAPIDSEKYKKDLFACACGNKKEQEDEKE
jgi:hypothetical protein